MARSTGKVRAARLTDLAALGEAHEFGRTRAQLAHRLFERDDVLLARHAEQVGGVVEGIDHIEMRAGIRRADHHPVVLRP